VHDFAGKTQACRRRWKGPRHCIKEDVSASTLA
jgi:hypothetical protein